MQDIFQIARNDPSKKGLMAVADICAEKLTNNGYVYSEAYGWEKGETLDIFGLKPTDKIPGQYYPDPESKTGGKLLCACQEYSNYKEYKKKLERQEYARNQNTPPAEDVIIPDKQWSFI